MWVVVAFIVGLAIGGIIGYDMGRTNMYIKALNAIDRSGSRSEKIVSVFDKMV